jgi:branched-subunit amino acid aminotransferase/4-amino-4-deoxychorismate lyase
VNCERLFWIDGERCDGYSDERVAKAFADVDGRGGRIVLPVVGGHIRFLERSLTHLEMAINAFGLRCPDISIDLELWAHQVTEAAGVCYQIELCVGITGPIKQQSECSVIHLARLAPWNPPTIRGASTRAVSSPWVRLSVTPLAGVCNISGLERYRLLNHVDSLGCDDGLWADEHGYVVEFASKSLLWLDGNSWIRPSADLNPTWNPVVELISENLEIARMKVRIEELGSAKAIVGVSSFGVVSTIAELDHNELPPRPDSVDFLERILANLLFAKTNFTG